MGKIDYSIIGRRFGRLTVLEFDGVDKRHASHWLCECDCGKITSVTIGHLTSGHTTSCGCRARERRSEDLTGKRFGYLTVLNFDHTDEYGGSYWLCECDCGKHTIKRQNTLTSSKAISCGCKRYTIDDLSGRRFNRLVVLSLDHVADNGDTCWLCECDCGNRTVVRRHNLIRGSTRSCGCYARERATTHGRTDTRLHNIWTTMLQRCVNSNNKSYLNYGGRGIFVCDEWHDFENFYNWAMINGYADNLTIDRINTNDGYYPENCRWADHCTQQNNRRNNHLVTYNNITHTVAEWSRLFNIDYHVLWKRIKRGNMRDFEEYYNERLD